MFLKHCSRFELCKEHNLHHVNSQKNLKMCFGFSISEQSRIRLCKAIIGFNVICLLYGKAMIVKGVYLESGFRSFAWLVSNYNAGYLQLLLLFSGVLSVVISVYGIFLCFKCIFPSQRFLLQMQMLALQFAIFIVCVLIMFAAISCFRQQDRVDNAFKVSIILSLLKLVIALARYNIAIAK